jgi:hypothetical protein
MRLSPLPLGWQTYSKRIYPQHPSDDLLCLVQPQLAGNSVHVDLQFLRRSMPKVAECLDFRIVDVSSINELCKRWCYGKLGLVPKKSNNHRAMDDVMESIGELAAYKEHVFNIPSKRNGKVQLYQLQEDNLYSCRSCQSVLA